VGLGSRRLFKTEKAVYLRSNFYMFVMPQKPDSKISFLDFRETVLSDFYIACLSRQMSLLGRKEVLTGKAKFGIFGDGKEVAQIAFARQFKAGDWRSGYYRDQTFMLATGMTTPLEFFAQLFGDTDLRNNPSNGGRMMVCHYASRSLDMDGNWKDLANQKNTAADLSPTAGQLPRLLGLAYASRLFRLNPALSEYKWLSNQGNEVAFGTIGDAATSEGHFFELMNAAGVLQVPLAMAVWDDGYGISVPIEYQTTKGSISELLKGFEANAEQNGILIYKASGWDYPGLCRIFEKGIQVCRDKHVPVLFHIDGMCQPLGHSTSGSHERYKSPERLLWEAEHDPIKRMRGWIIEHQLANEQELEELEARAAAEAREARNKARDLFRQPVVEEREKLLSIIENKGCTCRHEKIDKVALVAAELRKIQDPLRRDTFSAARRILRHICNDCPNRTRLQTSIAEWIDRNYAINAERFSSHIHIESGRSALKVIPVPPEYEPNPAFVTGREIIRDNFEVLFRRNPLLLTFGEDSGKLGDVNQCLEGLQEKFGELRVTDTGIRETTIIGQGIGLALRGLRPIAEIQYFDYILYALQTISDDLACTHWRTAGGQAVPLIIRTRGHRLEGVWHSGSPLSMVINSIRGVYVCVPRDLTRAAGFYNTLLEGDDPALVVEPLNAYRLKEKRPANLGDFRIPLGVPEILREGSDLTLVTYGSCVRIAQDAAAMLNERGIQVELIDVQTLLPFDIHHLIAESVKKTNRLVLFDEDVPGGATAFMMQQVLEKQRAFDWLDSPPVTITARDHRPAYASDGDYFSNPNTDDVFEAVYQLMHETDPDRFPRLFR
jgi:pyruvate/2-oxoglutarate/acetoin dehydrogenase E1 component/TPP-dependent pyruvate/acetoin dehydrogenase alpha subunit